MKEERILDVLGHVDEQYVTEADPMNDKISGCRTPDRRKFSRKALIAVAVAAALSISSLAAAMAANEAFRSAVFRFFKLGTPDIVLPVEYEPHQPCEIGKIGGAAIEDAVNVAYIRMDGAFDYANGVIHLYKHGAAAAAYTVEKNQLLQLIPHRETIEYVWHDTTYSISFDWYEHDGIVYASARDYNMETSAAWSVSAIEGNSDFLALTLNYGHQIEHTQYPLLYDLKAKKIVAILAGCEELKARQITQTTLAPDLSGVIVSCDFGSAVYYYNIAQQALFPLNDLCGMRVQSAWFADNDTVCCISADENNAYTCRAVTLSSGTYTEIFASIPQLEESSDGGIVLTGGRYGLFVDQARNTYVYDFKTGERAVVDSFKYPIDDAFSCLNSTGDKILFAKHDDSAKGLGVAEVGVLDLKKQSFILFDREGYETRRENSIGWFDRDTVVIWASTEAFSYLYLFTPIEK